MTQATRTKFTGLHMLTFTVMSFTAATVALMLAASSVNATPVLEPIEISSAQ